MDKLGNMEPTQRGFPRVAFSDSYRNRCSLQCSSAIADQEGYENPGTSFLWLGIDDAKPQVMARDASKHGIRTLQDTGWVHYPIHQDVSIVTSMHLNREQVIGLIERLNEWLETGTFSE